jgi:uncharacterized protein (DUF302 family)
MLPAGASFRKTGGRLVLAQPADRGNDMIRTASHLIGGSILAAALAVLTTMTAAADSGLITKASRYSVKDTVERFEAAVRRRQADGYMVFTQIDHAAAARTVGLAMLPRTVIVFGNPKVGTPVMQKTASVAIDVPPKALVWQDEQGKVWLTYNSGKYLGSTIYARHEVAPSPLTAFEQALTEFSDYATK